MKYEAREASIDYPNPDYEKDLLEQVYDDTQEKLEDDEIEDWEEGFLNGYAET